MTPSNKQYKFEDVYEIATKYIDDENKLEIIKKAYDFAKEKHKGQYRKSGEEYINHPIQVAYILTQIYADYESLSAAFLHDVLEDCDCEPDELEEAFGPTILKLVDGVTKLSRLHFSTDNDYLIEYYKKIIVGMSEDVRVIIIKLADRLHNMRTLWALPPDRQKVKAKEALEILAPIAHHLGIHKIKSELEDLSLRYLKPDVFYDIAEKLNNTKIERDKYVYDMQQDVSSLLTNYHIPHEIKGRSKSIYSIYNKMQKGKRFEDIYDLLALRILVNTKQECYLALGIIHSKYRPMPNRFKDYVAMPKPNMYQSLHTTVFGVNGFLFEIQIRTYDMDEIAENGIASHWAYKENGGSKDNANLQSTTEQKLQFFKSIIDLSHDNLSSEEFVNSVRDEVLNNNIYVFTPKGDVIELPKGATPVDFAYKIHTRVGDTTIGAIVNNSIVPLNYELKTNDIVKINTNKSSKPSKEWLNFVKSTQTKNKIKSFFTKNERDIYIERGKYILEKEIKKRKIPLNIFFTDENIEKICNEFKLKDLDDIYLNIGNLKEQANSIINIIDEKHEEQKPKIITTKLNKDTDIVVAGIDKVKVNLAACCCPVYGDKIVGYITKGNGITVHRITCGNLEMLEDRTIDVAWNDKQLANKKYLSCLYIYSNNLQNNIDDLKKSISSFNSNIDTIKILSSSTYNIYEVDLYVTSVENLEKIMMLIDKIDYVDRVERIYK